MISISDFDKVELRVGTVTQVGVNKKARKPAYKVTIDFGDVLGLKTSSAQITEPYQPEELIGKTCIAITNLPPRKMMGIDSCGMLISAVNKRGEDEELHLLMVDPHIPAGAKLY